MKVSAVIPVYNNFPLVNDLLVNLHRHSCFDDILVIDDCSPDEATKNGLAWWAFNLGVRVRQTPQNLGFLKASNYGMNLALGDIVCLISTDVIVEDDLSRILKRLLSEDSRRLIGGIVYNGSTGWNQFGSKIFPYAEGWLLACTKKAWEELGGFDEQFAPNDAEDIDISTTALSLGYTLHSLNNPKIRHIGGQSIGYGEQREELTRRNIEKFRQKWLP